MPQECDTPKNDKEDNSPPQKCMVKDAFEEKARISNISADAMIRYPVFIAVL
jgi:hypothetical protein